MRIKKYLLAFLVVITFPVYTKAQTFVEGSGGYMSEGSDISENFTDGFAAQFQFGKFVSNRKMRSVSFGIRKTGGRREEGSFSRDLQRSVYSSVLSNRTSINIGYERKVTFLSTEFDDTWQYYHILNYNVSIVTITETYSDPSVVLDSDRLAGTYVVPEFDLGLGMCRKFTQRGYIFTDVKCHFPFIEIENIALGFRVNLGVRYFLR